MFGIFQKQETHFQRLLNLAARVVLSIDTPPHRLASVTSNLKSLHCLPFHYHVQYKIAFIVFRLLSHSPLYLDCLFHLNMNNQHLCSAKAPTLLQNILSTNNGNEHFVMLLQLSEILYLQTSEILAPFPNYTKIAENCNLWRNFGDIEDSWESVTSIINFYGDDKTNFSKHAGPGNFNDPDMLIIGNFGLSMEQQKSQMALWCIMASPLIMSNDLRNIEPFSQSLLLNQYAIALTKML
ncbi:hypothetical protein HELRODRAFT_182706 [Helobdella robusta]|uniref:Alpha-galactosidase n=1 Tax=Helobdella robusta TaxID=6412 RepID=T1FIM1_HELRO|nr:hypothetical protein HELRODRAFT_182706 [Helobdella robusta]ESN90209.1 hypothetical protein HELRODRAFT_182706 [Helobdella robusta]